MATALKEGDRVRVTDRDIKAEDTKSQLLYPHLRGLTATIQKLYTSEEAVISIELDCLPEAILQRHLDVQESMKTKWLDGLSEEARTRLSPAERDFRLRYTALVAASDLIPVGTEAAARRPTTAELEAAEEAELRRRQNPPSPAS